MEEAYGIHASVLPFSLIDTGSVALPTWFSFSYLFSNPHLPLCTVAVHPFLALPAGTCAQPAVVVLRPPTSTPLGVPHHRAVQAVAQDHGKATCKCGVRVSVRVLVCVCACVRASFLTMMSWRSSDSLTTEQCKVAQDHGEPT